MVEADAERTAVGAREGCPHCVARPIRERRVGVEEEQGLSRGHLGAGVHRVGPRARRVDDPAPAAAASSRVRSVLPPSATITSQGSRSHVPR